MNEREEWIAQNESNVMVSYVAVASLEDLKIKIEKNKVCLFEFVPQDSSISSKLFSLEFK